jgi:Ubiquinol-cytochrome C reductase, UQCRX/QCR9 like
MQRAAAFAPRLAALPKAGSRSASTLGSSFYRYVAKSNVTYVSYIIGGAIVLEFFYGKTLDGLWNGLNSGVS